MHPPSQIQVRDYACPSVSRQSGVPLPLLLSVVGDDIAGDALLQHWQSAVRSPHRCISRIAGVSTPVVSILFDSAGEVPNSAL